jgi:hypothetical protein
MNATLKIRAPQAPHKLWSQHHEPALNWLALGLLLAAWNAADNDVVRHEPRRPQSLRGYSMVSVRAATLNCSDVRNCGDKGHKTVNVL